MVGLRGLLVVCVLCCNTLQFPGSDASSSHSQASSYRKENRECELESREERIFMKEKMLAGRVKEYFQSLSELQEEEAELAKKNETLNAVKEKHSKVEEVSKNCNKVMELTADYLEYCMDELEYKEFGPTGAWGLDKKQPIPDEEEGCSDAAAVSRSFRREISNAARPSGKAAEEAWMEGLESEIGKELSGG